MIIVLDSWAWIEYFSGSEHGLIVKDYLEKHQIITPNIVLLEIAGKYAREGFNREEILKRLLFIIKKSEIIDFDHELAVEAAECLIELRKHAKKQGIKQRPGIADGLILAITRKVRGKLLTGDKHFKGLRDVIFIKR
ncbi:MAG: PIN domain-containing protein [Candidatus Njordarchaeales archaeon]